MAAGILEAPVRPPLTRRTNGHVPPPPPPTGGGDDGERDPAPRRPLDNLRLAILFFIGAESMFFAALISALFVLRLGMPVWPPPLQPRLPVGLTGVNTLVLLGSSVAMIGAGRALARNDRRRLVRALGLAALLGGLFLAVQGYEWLRLIRFGLTMSSSTYGTTFYTLIGTHALHVAGALVWVCAILALAAAGRFSADRASGVRACAMYWHFVVALWPILYVAVYLL
jgi:heme/copper-type cytochrome/quinol oxidase subunit 3